MNKKTIHALAEKRRRWAKGYAKCPHCLVENTEPGLFKVEVGRTSRSCPNCYHAYERARDIFSGLRYRTEKTGLEFDLDLKWLFDRLKEPCPATGAAYEFKTKRGALLGKHPLSSSIDRIDPDKGYTKDNCRIVCWWYNQMKQRYTDSETINLCYLVVQRWYQGKFAPDVKLQETIIQEIT